MLTQCQTEYSTQNLEHCLNAISGNKILAGIKSNVFLLSRADTDNLKAM